MRGRTRAVMLSTVGPTEPEARVRRSDGVTDRAQEVGAHRVEIDLVSEPGAEGVERACRVIPGAVEAPVDDVLPDAAAAGTPRRRAAWTRRPRARCRT